MTDPVLSTIIVLVTLAGAGMAMPGNWRPTPLFASGDWGARFGFGGKRRQEPEEPERRPDSDILDEVAGGHYGGGRAVLAKHDTPIDESDPFDQIFADRNPAPHQDQPETTETPSIWSLPTSAEPETALPPPPPPLVPDSSWAEPPANDGQVILPPPPPPPPAPDLSQDLESPVLGDVDADDLVVATPDATKPDASEEWSGDMGLLEAIANMATSSEVPTAGSDEPTSDAWSSPRQHGIPSVPELPLSAPPAVPFGDLAPPAESETDADSWHSWQWANATTDSEIGGRGESTGVTADADEWDFEIDGSMIDGELLAAEQGDESVGVDFGLPTLETAFGGDQPLAPSPVRDASALQAAASDFFGVLDSSPAPAPLDTASAETESPTIDQPVAQTWLPDVTSLDDDVDEDWDEPVPAWDDEAWPEPATSADAGNADTVVEMTPDNVVEMSDAIESVTPVEPVSENVTEVGRVPSPQLPEGPDRWASSLLDRLRSVVEAPAEAPDALAEFEQRFERGLTLRLTDDQVFEYLGRGLDMIVPDAESQILHANEIDSLDEVGRAGQQTRPGCAVSRGDLCPAIVQRQTMQFENSEHLDACPHMANRGGGAFAATCVPIIGEAESESGVLHITTLVNGRLHADTVAAIEKAATQSAERLGRLGTRQQA